MNPTEAPDIEDIDLSDLTLWKDGPPHEIFRELRHRDLHFSALGDFPREEGFWSVVRFDNIAEVGRDWETFSSNRSILVVDSIAAEPGAQVLGRLQVPADIEAVTTWAAAEIGLPVY